MKINIFLSLYLKPGVALGKSCGTPAENCWHVAKYCRYYTGDPRIHLPASYVIAQIGLCFGIILSQRN
jgi:hypothetical protein